MATTLSMLDKRKLITLAATALALVVSFGLQIKDSSQPGYQGRSAAQWMAVFASNRPDEQARAIRAFQAMGTNALPALIQYLGKRDSAIARWRGRLADHVPLPQIHFTCAWQWRWRAMDVLFSSGLFKAPAVVSVAAQLTHDPDAGVRRMPSFSSGAWRMCIQRLFPRWRRHRPIPTVRFAFVRRWSWRIAER